MKKFEETLHTQKTTKTKLTESFEKSVTQKTRGTDMKECSFCVVRQKKSSTGHYDPIFLNVKI